jgi:hypothetical protein
VRIDQPFQDESKFAVIIQVVERPGSRLELAEPLPPDVAEPNPTLVMTCSLEFRVDDGGC